MIRDATAADAAGIRAIWNPIIQASAITFWPSPRSEADIAAMIAARQAAGHGFFVAEGECGAIHGFATYTQFRSGGGYAKSLEHSINLAPEARGAGLGARLLRAVEHRARAGGGRLMIGAITATNAPSLRFHAAQGYAEWGRIPAAGWKLGQFHDLVLMGKDLAAA